MTELHEWQESQPRFRMIALLPTLLLLLACNFSAEQELLSEDVLANSPDKTIIIHFKSRPIEHIVEEAKKKASLTSNSDYTSFVPELLAESSSESQHEVIQILEKRKQARAPGGNYTRLWAFNLLLVRDADPELLKQIKGSKNVQSVLLDEEFCVDIENPTPAGNLSARFDAITWGVKKVKAPEVWAQGYKGQGVAIGVIDSGVRASHAALRRNFRKEYGWFDAVNGRPEPYDDLGHGSHCAGSALGTNGIGVAPEAQLMACKFINAEREGKNSAAMACFQWMFCPSMNGTEDCSKRPKILSNSWGSSSHKTIYYDILEKFTSVGTIHVFAAGNNGPECGSLSGVAQNPQVVVVGSVGLNGGVYSSSSRGPTLAGDMKPDILGPGQEIASCSHLADEELVDKTGTSMATPHVAGIAALLASKDPSIDQERFRQILRKSADTCLASSPTNEICGEGDKFPNNNAGWGLADALKAMEYL